MNSAENRSELKDLSYDYPMDWFLSKVNIANQQLVRDTIAHFSVESRASIYQPLEFLNLLYKQYRFVLDNFRDSELIVAHFKNLPLEEERRHILLGLILKWFGGYPANCMNEWEQNTLDAIEQLFLSFPFPTPEKEFCRIDVDRAKYFMKMGMAFTTAINEGVEVADVLRELEDAVPQKANEIFKTFEALFGHALKEKWIDIPKGKDLKIQESAYCYAFNCWLIDVKKWELRDKDGYSNYLTKQAFTEFLKQYSNITYDDLLNNSTEYLVAKQNELSEKYAPGGHYPVLKNGGHMMQLLREFYAPWLCLDIRMYHDRMDGPFTIASINGLLKDINEFIRLAERSSYTEVMREFENLPFNSAKQNDLFVYYRIINNKYAESPLWKNALISNGKQYDFLSMEHHTEFIEVYAKYILFKNYLEELLQKLQTQNPVNLVQPGKKKFEYDFNGQAYFDIGFPDVKSVSLEEVMKKYLIKIALVVATEVELKQALFVLKPLQKNSKILKVTYGHETHYVGLFGKFGAVVTMCSMGSEGATGSTLTVEAIIRNFRPIAVVMVGIAFGADPDKHYPGDVMIADKIIPYESQRRGKEIIYRSAIPPVSPLLLNRFRNALNWSFRRPDGTLVSKHIGPVFSGEKLVDDGNFKQQLLTDFPTAIGGEMEGQGLYAASARNMKHWILIKAVCDWADGQKHKQFQQMAAASAVSLCVHVFDNPHALDGVEL